MTQQPDARPVALYARVSSDRQDVDLSVAAQLRALRDYAAQHGYVVAREYVDEAESGRVADRPQFRQMIDDGSRPTAPFQEILVWKFSRFTRKREHAVAFKSMLRRKGIRVVSITEPADDSPTGKLMEAIIESVDEFYSENLAQEVTRGMREAASRGYFLGSRAPFGYRRVKVNDGLKDRPTLEVDPATAPVVREIFESSLRGHGLKEICRELNDRGLTNRGARWYKGGLHYLLTNEAYTGTAVWGRTVKGEKNPDPVRVEGAWPALVARELFDAVQRAMRDRAPKVRRPARVGSKFLLSGLLRCGVCGRPYTGQGAKSGRFAYYVCGTLHREGAGTCEARYLNAPRVEAFVVEKIRERILTEATIVELVTLVAEEIDAMAGELAGRLAAIDAELADVRQRLARLYEALETSALTLEALSPRILALRHREDQLQAAREAAAAQVEQRRVELPTTEEIKGYVADFRVFLQEGTIPERKALIRNFVEGIEVVGDEATLTYTIPMPNDGVTRESTPVLDFVQSGPPSFGQPRVEACQMNQDSRVFLARAGRSGEDEDRALEHNVAIIRFQEVESLASAGDVAGVRGLVASAYPDSMPRALDNFARQLWAFASTMKEGDFVVLPRKRTSQIAIGLVKGPYEYRKLDGTRRHTRSVEWLQTELPRTAFEQDLLYSFGAFMTVCNISRNDAQQRVAAVANGRKDPGLKVSLDPPAGNGSSPADPPEALSDLSLYARDQIVAHIQTKFSGHALANLVDAVLCADGWETTTSSPGPDGGVDILAGRGSLGLDEPRLCVQVKTQNSPADVTVYRTLLGTMQTFNAQQGLLVCWGGFKKSVKTEARTGHFSIRLWDSDELVKAIYRTYKQLAPKVQAELPLKQEWVLVVEDSDS